MKNIVTLFSLTAVLVLVITINGYTHKLTQEQQTSQHNATTIRTEQVSDENTHSTDTLAGIVKSYNTRTEIGCLYVDKGMIAAEVAKPLGSYAHKGLCQDETYGIGALISFQKLDQNSDYPTAPNEDILISIIGQWQTMSYAGYNDVHIFYADNYEPFF